VLDCQDFPIIGKHVIEILLHLELQKNKICSYLQFQDHDYDRAKLQLVHIPGSQSSPQDTGKSSPCFPTEACVSASAQHILQGSWPQDCNTSEAQYQYWSSLVVPAVQLISAATAVVSLLEGSQVVSVQFPTFLGLIKAQKQSGIKNYGKNIYLLSSD